MFKNKNKLYFKFYIIFFLFKLHLFGYINPLSIGLYNHETNNTVDNNVYCEMVRSWLINALERDGVSNLTLMQDGARIHTCTSTLKFLKDNNLNILDFWPGYSPDLNPIENLWALLKNKLRNSYSKNGLPADRDAFYNDTKDITTTTTTNPTFKLLLLP